MSYQLLASINTDLQRKTSLNKKRRQFSHVTTTPGIATVLIGERGVGKTYMTLQYLKEHSLPSFYISADNTLVSSLFELVYQLYTDYGIRLIAIDEIHKGTDRQQHLKNIIDSFPELHLIVLGSSSIDLYKGTAALARRTKLQYLSPLSFSEYCERYHDTKLPSLSFDELMSSYKKISFEHASSFPKTLFQSYLAYGAYPFFDGNIVTYQEQLRRNLSKTILEDIPTFLNLETKSLHKLEKLFYLIAHTSPSDFNYSNIAQKLGFAKERLESIMMYLDKIGVINTAVRSNKLSDIIRKEFKAFLGNPNMYYAYTPTPNIGTIREAYVLHTLKHTSKKETLQHDIILPSYGDIAYTHNKSQYFFEVGGKKKQRKGAGGKNAYIVADDVYVGTYTTIPLWMFGLLE